MDSMELLKKLALEIEVKRGTDIETCKEDECYELDQYNRIIGVIINVEDYQFVISKTVERDIYKVYADNQVTGENATVIVDSRGSVMNILNFLETNRVHVRFYDVDLSAIGKFYKPNNNSKFNYINDQEDEETLCYLLRYLQNKGLVEVKTDFDGIPKAIQEWNKIRI